MTSDEETLPQTVMREMREAGRSEEEIANEMQMLFNTRNMAWSGINYNKMTTLQLGKEEF